MHLLKFGEYTPEEEPTSYQVTESDIYASENDMEDGTVFVERSRSNVYSISVGYTNISQETLCNLMTAISVLKIPTQFYFGVQRSADMRVKNKNIVLKSIISRESRWNLTFELEEF